MQDFTSIEKLQNATVYGNDEDKIGFVGQVYLDDQTNQPTFVTVKTGLFGRKETFVPVAQATPSQDGLQVPFDKAFVKDAPNTDADGSLTPAEERRIFEYYSLDYQDSPAADDAAAANRELPGAGQDTDSVVAREEHLNVGTEARETGQVRLRKHTETVAATVQQDEVTVQGEEAAADRR